MLCPKCNNNLFTTQDGSDGSCMICGYSPTVVSADALAEFERNLNRKTLKGRHVQLPSLPKWMPAYILDETDDELETVLVPPVRPERKLGEWRIW